MTYTAGYQVAQGPPPGPKKPSLALPILGALVLVVSVVVGLLLLTVFGTVSRSDRIADFGRFLVEDGGTEAELEIKTSGDYTIYYEYAGEVDGEELDADSNPPDDLNLTVVNDDDDEVRVRVPRDQLEFTAGDREGVSVGTVDFRDTGDYSITATGGDEPYAISLGRGSLDEDMSNDTNKLAGILVLVVGGLVGVVLLLLGLAQRGRGGGARQPTYPPAGYQQPPTYAGTPQGGYEPTGSGWASPPTQPQGGWPGPTGPQPGGWGAPPPNQPGSPNPPFPGP